MRHRFIDRDKDGNITGTYARPQYDGQEFLPDDDPEVIAFQTRPLEAATEPDPDEEKIQAEIRAMAIERLQARGELAAGFVDRRQLQVKEVQRVTS